jgi:hypothetical protein
MQERPVILFPIPVNILEDIGKIFLQGCHCIYLHLGAYQIGKLPKRLIGVLRTQEHCVANTITSVDIFNELAL